MEKTTKIIHEAKSEILDETMVIIPEELLNHRDLYEFPDIISNLESFERLPLLENISEEFILIENNI